MRLCCLTIASVVIGCSVTKPAKPTPQLAATTRPNPDLWARRNIDLIRQATTRKVDPLDDGGIESTLMFSADNLMLFRAPYAQELLKTLEPVATQPSIDPKVPTMGRWICGSGRTGSSC